MKKREGHEHIYEIGDIVGQGTLRVVEQIRNKHNHKVYMVQSLKYENETEPYRKNESELKKGYGDSYLTNRKIFEGNSLYSVEWVRPYLVNIEQAKTIAPQSNKKIYFKCPTCNSKKLMAPNHLLNKGIACFECSDIKRYHIYKIGEVVGQGTLKVIKQTRNNNRRAYEVKSIKYPKAPTYTVEEVTLKNGSRDSYLSNQRIFEGNSLWSKVEYRKYIVDVEQAKTIAPQSNKLIKTKCPECDDGKIKMMPAGNLVRQGFSCPICSTNTKYPELWFMGYFESKNVPYETQVTHNNLNLPYDFRINLNGKIIYLEIQGVQHYVQSEYFGGAKAWGHQKASDLCKKRYCEQFGHNLIIIDARESSFEFMKEQVNKCDALPNVEESEIPLMLEIMKLNKRYPTKEIIGLYQKGYTLVQLSKIYNTTDTTIGNILKRNNIEIRSGRLVRCVTTGELFNSVNEARDWAIKGSKISDACRGKRNSAGRHPETNEPLTWEYS